jgi:hypothetical protein
MLSRIQLEEPIPEPVTEPATQDTGLSELPSATSGMPTQSEVNFAAVLTNHLSRFARQQMMMGIIPTDEMFQRESRRLLYQDGDDDWNQTVADNPNWLQEFRKRNGLDGETGASLN